MTTPLIEKLNITSSVSIVIISISLMLFGGFAMTRITKRLKLPNVTAYIVAGILMGPYCLNLIPVGLIERMDFIADIALAFIAFSTGEFFRFSTLKKSGVKVLLITFLEACLASIAVFIATHYVLGLDMVFSVVLAALASATAPASTLLQVVALDDVVGLVAYSIAISIALASMTGNFQAQNVLRPIIMNLFAFALGGVFGLILKFLLHKRSTDNRLIVSIALLFAFCGICALMGVSSLLGCMSMSMIYINTSDDERLFKQLNYFSPPLLLLFFVRSGLNFDLGAIFSSSDHIGSASLLAVGVVYFVTRILGKYIGAFLGCLLAGKNKKVRNNLGLALIPQAGVAIGLAAMGARTLGGAMGDALETIILASGVLYELIGPACAKLSLYLSGSYSNRLDDIVTETVKCDGHEPENEVERLIRQIQAIQKELPAHNDPFLEDEQAYDEAAYEHYALTGYPQVSYQNTRRKADIWTL